MAVIITIFNYRSTYNMFFSAKTQCISHYYKVIVRCAYCMKTEYDT